MRLCRVSPGPRAVAATPEYIVWTDVDEAAVYLLQKDPTRPSSGLLRVVKTGLPRLAALTIAKPASSALRRMPAALRFIYLLPRKCTKNIRIQIS